MIIGCPVMDKEEMTKEFVEYLNTTIEDTDNFKLVFIDNGSDTPYKVEDYPSKFPIEIIYNKENRGYYYPLLQLYEKYDDELIGLVHNDVLFYEKNWHKRMEEGFANDPKLGLIGIVGSNEIDSGGGRGGGTMCFYRGEKGQSQAAGLRITDLRAALVLDSVFMLFRREVVPSLKIDNDITLCHFYDRIWPCRTIEAGYRVAVLGTEVDHVSGITACGNPKFLQQCIDWLDKRNIPLTPPYNFAETEMYLVGERRFLGEFRDEKHFLPCLIKDDYTIVKY